LHASCELKRNLSQAIIFYQKLAQQKYFRAINHLYYCYENENGFEKDTTKAINLLKKGVQLRNAQAICNFGI
jgi:TPR repeat protein